MGAETARGNLPSAVSAFWEGRTRGSEYEQSTQRGFTGHALQDVFNFRHTTMKLLHHLTLTPCVVFFAAAFALADEPATPSGQALGMIEGILDKCAKVDPKAAAAYVQQAKTLTQHASEDAVTQLRRSDEYKQSFGSITESLAQVSELEAKKACAQMLAAGK